MQRKLGLYIIAIFLSVQTLTLAHMARHGFLPHMHHGHVCDIYLDFDHVPLADAPAIIFIAASIAFILLTLSPTPSIFRKVAYAYAKAPRAPPCSCS